jgi:methylated-DNA-protein-cysteine methyltransferase-like protein
VGYFDDIRKTVLLIPRGRVATYGSVACAAGHPGTARQVAWALRGKGSEALPWQRVVGHGGRISLPGEAGLEQRLRLEMEGVRFAGRRVSMKEFGFDFPAARRKRGAAGRLAKKRSSAK